MLTLHEHNRDRLAHLKARGEDTAGVDCDGCRAPMVLADFVQCVVGAAPAVAVKCPRCGARGVMIL